MTMEKRAILAFGLSMVLLVAYMWVQEQYFTPPPATAPEAAKAPAQAPAEQPSVPKPPATEAPPRASSPAGSAEAAESTPPKPRPPEQRVRVSAPLYRAVLSSEGGELKEWTLEYRGEKPMVVLGEQGGGGLAIGAGDAKGTAPVAMTPAAKGVTLEPGVGTKELVLTGEEAGVRVRHTLSFHPDGYVVDAVVRIENPGTVPRTLRVELPWSSRQEWGGTPERFIGQRPTELVWSAGGQVQRRETVGNVPEQQFEGQWIGLGSVWYLAALVPRSGGWQLALSGEAKNGKNVAAGPAGRVAVGLTAMPTIGPGAAWEGRAQLYIGPKEYERLAALGLEGTLDFGGFPLPRRYGGLPMEWLGVPILLLMKWLYRFVGNYGIAIILVTIVSKVLFYPLTVKSMRSMKAMQALQPQVNALRAKYKSDPQRAQREMMDLYRKHRVNPMGGCLPMVAQVPIFYALYLALSVSVELQSAGFLCIGRVFGVDIWICDLAAQDPTYVLPVLMGVTMFVQQKMTPVAGDPRQAKMMLVMPFVFTFMFLSLPSGLVLYWTVSNVLQILQQWYMNRPKTSAVREVKDASRA
ncbi:MAG: membrane protein insertase YidC [Candidatus Rokubacteria bacterium]|nr:membrane protein insertase YidC [Candidatus Rokubacteria bacterium]